MWLSGISAAACGIFIAACGIFCCDAQNSLIVELRLSSCSTGAQLLRGTLAVATPPRCDPGKLRPLALSPRPLAHDPARLVCVPPGPTALLPKLHSCTQTLSVLAPVFFPWNSKMQLLLSPLQGLETFSKSLFLS